MLVTKKNINRRMSNCKTVVQPEKDLFEPEIQKICPKLPNFGTFSDSEILKNLSTLRLKSEIFHG